MEPRVMLSAGGLIHEQEKSADNHYGLKSPWELIYNPIDQAPHGRFECEADDLVVFGDIPKEIDGTFYRLHPDPNVLPKDDVPFIDGDGMISAFRIINGKVSMKMKYIETERYLLERQAGKRLFGRYRNPYDCHPCVRMANDNVANTNIIYWGGELLAMAERGLPYSVDPDTLETKTYDPYGGQTKARAFTAHPKEDRLTNELVTYSMAAKGLHSPDYCTYSVSPDGKISNEFWFKTDVPGSPHDAWVTENWIILSNMPFRVNKDENMREENADHWVYAPYAPHEFLVAPRRPNGPQLHGWKEGEFRTYIYEPGLVIHTGGGWEEKDGTLTLESPWATFNTFPFFTVEDGSELPKLAEGQVPTSDWVRWKLDLTKPSGTKVADPEILYRGLTDFPAIDDRLVTQRTKIVYLTCMAPNAFRFEKIVRLDTETGQTDEFFAPPNGGFAEPVLIRRSDDAPEGDGWLLVYTFRSSSPKGELTLLDTRDMKNPIAVIQLPFQTRLQVHGNWVPNPHPGTPLPPLAEVLEFFE
ncbi:lignostilbene dioxygenase [Cadophora sp. MPI-SDFR-AT-0126]|nr:lignostilbene dioxygenase [Leotiomycetes sp. MPI-SDFR-AT-0126]